MRVIVPDLFARECDDKANVRQWRNILTGGPWTNYIKGPIYPITEHHILTTQLDQTL